MKSREKTTLLVVVLLGIFFTAAPIVPEVLRLIITAVLALKALSILFTFETARVKAPVSRRTKPVRIISKTKSTHV